jgi:hypothetical protein
MTIISIIFILIVHHLILFFKDNLTVPKVKDLVNVPAQKYQAILDIISKKENSQPEFKYSEENGKIDTESMKNELKSFLKEQFNNKTTSLDNLPSSNDFQTSNEDLYDPSSYSSNAYSSY